MDSKMHEAFEKWKESHVWLRNSIVGNFSEIAVMREAFEAGAAWVRAEGAKWLEELQRELAISMRVCGNWREFHNVPNAESEKDWQYALRAIMERAEGAEREKRLREAANLFCARVKERDPEWFRETDTDFAYAQIKLVALLAPSSDERGTMEWTACSCDPEYAHHCVFCGGTGRIKRVLKLDERGRETT